MRRLLSRSWRGVLGARVVGHRSEEWQDQEDDFGDAAGDSGGDAGAPERDMLNSDTIYVGSGSDYYFPPSVTTAQKMLLGRTSPAASAPKVKPVHVKVKTSSRYYMVDVSTPPVTAEEAERWKLDRVLYYVAPHFLPNAEHTRYLLPPTQRLTSLGPRMAQVERLYRLKGFFTPSEVAHVFVPVTPTYFVEIRHILNALPADILDRLSVFIQRGAIVTMIFSRYPMLFKVSRSTYRKSLVKLNLDFDFVRRYPGCGRGDRMHQRHNAERSKLAPCGAPPTGELVGPARQVLDMKILQILLRHLPRAPAPDVASTSAEEQHAARYRAVPLVSWINGFTAAELNVLNQVPQQHVVLLISRFVRIFQLVSDHGEDDNLYADRSHRTRWSEAACAPPDAASTAAPETSAAATQRTQRFLRSVQDDLIGLDETLAPTPDVGAEAVSAVDDAEFEKDGNDNDDDDDDEDNDAARTREGRGAEVEREYVPINYDNISVRRLPPSIAPRSLSNFNEHTTPDPQLAQLAASLLAPPPSLRKYVNNYFATAARSESVRWGTRECTVNTNAWRWVRVERVYRALTPAQRQQLRRYKGLANFLRLHGELFELSEDLLHYIAHDPSGTIAPLLPTQKRFGFEERMVLPPSFDDDPDAAAALLGEAERKKYEAVLGPAQLPMSRSQLILLDAHNPVLQSDILNEEIAQLLPARPVSKSQFLARLPPVLRAAMGANYSLRSNRHFRVWSERGLVMMQRGDGTAAPATTPQTTPTMTLEEAVEELTGVIPETGVTLRSLRRMHLSSAALDTLEHNFGDMYNAVRAFPQYFTMKQDPRLGNSLVYLRSDVQAPPERS